MDAVIRHLTWGRPDAEARNRAETVASDIRILTGGENGEMLLADPELLASLFQNADLLEPGDTGGAAILASVMAALAAA